MQKPLQIATPLGKTTTKTPASNAWREAKRNDRTTDKRCITQKRESEREGDAQILNRVGIEMESGSKNNGRSTDGPMHGNGANPVKVEPRSKGGKLSASRYRGRQLSRLGGDDVRCPTTARSDVFSPRRNIKSPLSGYLRIKYGLKRIDMQGVDMGVLTECLVVLHLEERVFYRKLKQRKRSVR